MPKVTTPKLRCDTCPVVLVCWGGLRNARVCVRCHRQWSTTGEYYEIIGCSSSELRGKRKTRYEHHHAYCVYCKPAEWIKEDGDQYWHDLTYDVSFYTALVHDVFHKTEKRSADWTAYHVAEQVRRERAMWDAKHAAETQRRLEAYLRRSQHGQ